MNEEVYIKTMRDNEKYETWNKERRKNEKIADKKDEWLRKIRKIK